MASLFRYYQLVGGEEEWTPIQANLDLAELKPTFVTILGLDTLLDDEPDRETLDAVKYSGPMYFDLDDAESVANTLVDAVKLLDKLVAAGLKESDVEIYLSGKKGLHFIIPQVCFMEKPVPIARLPAIYKEMAFKLAVDTVDFAVYTARKGRMLRTCFNIRENGNYRVPVTAAELRGLDAEGYQNLCKSQRQAPMSSAEFRPQFAIAFEAAKQKVQAVKRKKIKPVDAAQLKQHGPIVAKLMNGEVLVDTGFNKVAIQVALYAREARIKEDTLVSFCAGLIQNHQSDGNRYNSAAKRERELRRMIRYVEDNPSYEYSIEPIKAMLRASELAESGDFESDDPDSDEAQVRPVFSLGVSVGDIGYLASKGEEGDVAITNFLARDVVKCVEISKGLIVGLQAFLYVEGLKREKATLSPLMFTGGSTLQNAVSVYGGSFSGSDLHARGIFQTMLRSTNETRLIIDHEGVSLVKVPNSSYQQLREPFLVWADVYGVKCQKQLEGTGISFEYQGYPEAEGIFQTDLTRAPALKEIKASPEGVKRFKDMLIGMTSCQHPGAIGKMLGWCAASFFRPLFHEYFQKFPLLHIYGQAGAGKSEMMLAFMRMFYYTADPVTITPGSTPFAFQAMLGATGSIPVMLDEYKPHTMSSDTLEKYRALFRDSYNMKTVSRGGGSKKIDNYAALSKLTLAAPIAFIAEAIETEPAIMERSVVVTLQRPSTYSAAKSYRHFQAFVTRSDMLSAAGMAMAARMLSPEIMPRFREMFSQMFAEMQDQHMLREGDVDLMESGEMTADEFSRRSKNKMRNVYNNTVALFGLNSFKSICTWVLGDEFAELEDKFKELGDAIFSTMDAANRATVAEYIKVLTNLSDMARVADTEGYKLVEGVEYNLSEYGSKSVILLSPRACYFKYRLMCRTVGQNPLFPSESSFIQALRDCPQFMNTHSGTAKLPVEALVMARDELVASGMADFPGRVIALPKS